MMAAMARLHLDLTDGGLAAVLHELGLVHAGHLAVLVVGDALRLQTLVELVEEAAALLFDHDLGDIGLDVAGDLLEQSVLKGDLGGLLTLGRDLGLGVVLELLERLKLGNVLGELIVERRGLLFLDLVDLDVEHDLLAGEIPGVVLGEGDVDVLLLTGLHADDLILKAGNEAARADLQLVVLALAALEGNAVVKAPQKSMTAVSPFLTLRSTETKAGLTLRPSGSGARPTSSAVTLTSSFTALTPLYWPSSTSG